MVSIKETCQCSCKIRFQRNEISQSSSNLFEVVIYIDKSRHEKAKENSEQISPIADFELWSKSRQLLRKEIHLQGQMSMLPTNNVGLEYMYKLKIDSGVIKSFDEFTKKYYYLSTIM